jgi:hypothetical protein
MTFPAYDWDRKTKTRNGFSQYVLMPFDDTEKPIVDKMVNMRFPQ